MFIARVEYSTNGVRRSGIQLDLQLAITFPLLRTPPEGFCSSSYKHATPNGVNPNAFFHNFWSWWMVQIPPFDEGRSAMQLSCLLSVFGPPVLAKVGSELSTNFPLVGFAVLSSRPISVGWT